MRRRNCPRPEARHEWRAMTQTSPPPVASLAFVVILALAAVAVRHGLVADDALRLWAGASTAADGQVPIGRIVAAYPTLPFLTTTLVAWLAPAGTPAPALVAAGLFALVAAFCFLSFRKAGLPIVAAAVVHAADRVPSGAAAGGHRRARRHVPRRISADAVPCAL